MTISTTPLPVTTEAEVASSPAKGSRFWAWLILLLGALYFLVPLGATFYWSLRAEKGVLGFEAYRRLFADSNFWPSFTESVVNAVAAILLSLLIIVPTAYWVTLKLPKLRPVVEFITLLPFVIPAIVLVFGLIRLYSRPPLLLTATYGSSRVLLVCAYAALSFPYMFRSVDNGLRAMDVRSLTEAAQSLGAGWPTILRRVIFPNLRVALLSGALLTFAIVIGELTIALFLAQQTFGPYMANLVRSKVYEPSAMAIVAFGLTWVAMGAIAFITRPGEATVSGGFLSLEGVHKEFNGVVAVDSFDLEVEPGEFVSFLGPSGCGKTTTLRMVAGFEPPTSGTIRLAGEDVTYAKPNERNIGMVFQSYALFPNMTVSENIAFGLRVRKEENSSRDERVAELLDLIHLPDKAKSYPNELSGGQQQRVALARALAIRPQLLLLDEPLSALDAKIRDDLRAEIRRIQRQLNITTIYVTHDQEEALALSDRIVVMSKGQMEQVGEPFEIYNNPATGFVASFVGQLNRLPVTVIDPALGRLRVGQAEVRTTSLIESPEGAEVSLMMRPEEITLDAEEENVLEGTVEAVTFLGSIVRIQVAVDGGRLTADLFNERLLELPAAGDATQVSFPSHACWVMV